MCAVQADSSSDTELARRATGGDGEAFGLLFDRWLDRAFDVAWHILHNREAAADATQDAFAAAWQQVGSLRQPESFGGWLLRITRNKALNQLQKQRRSSPIGSEETLAMMDPRQTDDPSKTLDQKELGDLVWAASAALGEEDASLLNLHLRNNLGAAELGQELGVQPNAAHQRLFRLKKRLAEVIGAWVLWRHGTPSCPDLHAALERAKATSFNGATAKTITTHVRDCESCDSNRKLQLSPEAMFAAMPLVVAGPILRARMAAALDGEGVPVPADEPHAGPASRPRQWTAAAKVGAVTAAVLLGGVGALAVLADRAGDGTGDASTEDIATGAGANSGRAAPSTSDEVAELDEPTTSSTSPADTDAEAPEPVDNPPQDAVPEDVTSGSVTTQPPGTTEQPGTPAPEILRFVATSTNQPCPSTAQGAIEVTFSWETSDATSATLGEDGGGAEAVPPSSTTTRCAQPGSTWALTATGPGGTASDRTSVPASPPPQPSGPDDLTTP